MWPSLHKYMIYYKNQLFSLLLYDLHPKEREREGEREGGREREKEKERERERAIAILHKQQCAHMFKVIIVLP